MSDFIQMLFVVLPTVIISLWWAFLPSGNKRLSVPKGINEILYKNGVVEHATEEALKLLPITIGSHNWQDLHDILHLSFPDFPIKPKPPLSPDTVLISNQNQNHRIRIIWRGESVSLRFEDISPSHKLGNEHSELNTLRHITSFSPHPAWKTDTKGTLIWSNNAYKKLTDGLQDIEACPNKHIFDLPPLVADRTTNRVKIEVADSGFPEWYDIARTPVDDGVLHHATSLTALIRAENAQRDLVQTLAKTFAHLSIGLAIFNRDRQLALFNPALIDLTGLPVSFLSPRPTLDAFFDALRENRCMPEPKNYNTWRQRISDLVSAAETGRFEETWTLETGQTYRVKGRPHPDGAVAFLVEDISAEISLTRNFRAELELGQSLVDTFEDALAVFSQSGIMTFSNKAYDLLWGFQFDTGFADVTIADAVNMWKEKSSPTPLWQDLQDAVMSLGEREEWEMPVKIKGQHSMNCKIVPIASGATVIRFSRKAPLISPQLKPASISIG